MVDLIVDLCEGEEGEVWRGGVGGALSVDDEDGAVKVDVEESVVVAGLLLHFVEYEAGGEDL